MSDVIAEYQKWKQEGDNLRVQAKQAMESRFRQLLAEAVQMAEEYRADFGGPLKPSPPVTAFRYKAGARGKAKKAAKSKLVTAAAAKPAAKPKPAETRVEAQAQKADPKVVRLNKKLEAARKKLEDAKAGGAATRTLEDKVYEIEDELRLSGQKV